jgi:peptide/nickel transport system substrate-binding protein
MFPSIPSSRRVVAAAMAALLSMTLVACASNGGDDPSPTTLRVGISNLNFASIDPLNYGSVIGLDTQPVYEALLAWDQTNNTYAPWLAESFELADDRLSMRMKIREGIEFVDGTPLNAKTIAESFDMLLVAEGFIFRFLAADLFVMSVEAESEQDLVIRTELPISDRFLRFLTHAAVVSPTALANPALVAEEPVGTGPYQIEERVPEVSTTFVRNPDYWNPESFPFDRIEYTYFSDSVAALNALKSGQIDVTTVPNSSAAEAEGDGFTLHEGAGFYYTLLIRDVRGELVPALADPRVRRAMNQAFDRVAINETLNQGYGRIDDQPFGPAEPFYVDRGAERYSYDLTAARELMEQAGYADGFSIQIPVDSSSALVQPIVAQSLADIGITVEFVVKPAQADIDAAAPEFPVLLQNQAYINAMFLLQNTEGLSGFDKELTSLIATVEQGTTAESAEAASLLGERVLDLAVFVPFSHPATLYATVPEIQMVVGDLTGLPRLFRITPVGVDPVLPD